MIDPSLIDSFSSTRILCLGDVMLDHFIRGSVSRISPEAPVPILHIQDETTVLGGAGNVVRNLEALGSQLTFISVVGDDRNGVEILDLLNEYPHVTAHILKDKTRQTTTKTRFVASNQQILRTDWEKATPISAALEKKVFDLFTACLPDHDLVILSDYAKGFFSSKGLQALIQEAKKQGKPTLVDPKGADFDKYKGATYLTPNRQEFCLATRSSFKDEEEVIKAGQYLISDCDIDALLITRGSEGMTLMDKEGTIEHFPTQALEVFDVSGAGDTVIATFAIALAAGASILEAIQLANTAAGIVVSKVGTAVVHRAELLSTLYHQDIEEHERKIVSLEQGEDIVKRWQRLGQRVVFTNGCFDLLHPGHIALLRQAKRAGDRLVLGLNTDCSVQRLKGPQRPIQSETARAFVLSSLRDVDLVILFDEDTPLNLIQTLRPDVLVKGADYTIDKVVGAPFVQSYGGEVLLIDLVEGQSTTHLATKMAV